MQTVDATRPLANAASHLTYPPALTGTDRRESARRRAFGLTVLATRLGIGLALLVFVLSLLAPWLTQVDPVAVDLATGLRAPSTEHWLGTDQLGRDVWSRVLWAGRTSILLTVIVLALAVSSGLGLGLVSGYFGGLVDNGIMRLADLVYALPHIILALTLIGAVGPSPLALVAALALSSWVPYSRLVRSLVLANLRKEYVVAAQALGVPHHRILLRYLAPAVVGPLIVQVSLDVGGVILAIAGLSFLGLGIQPPTPEWGALLVEARPFLGHAPHLVLPPGLAIFFVVFGFNALAEAVEQRLRTPN
jgi:peptide/nickel transport system permease protein